MKKKNLFMIVLAAVITCSSAVFAASPLGPPMAGLSQGQSAVAFEYGYSKIDIDVHGSGLSDTLEDVKSNTFFIQPGFGVTDDLQVYGLLGFADADFDEFDDDLDFTYGFGAKLTVLKQEKISWGAVFEMDWRDFKDSGAELDYYEMTIAFGPTIHITDTFRIYGGPFYYILNGDIDVDDTGVGPTEEEEEQEEPPIDEGPYYYGIRGATPKGLTPSDLVDLGGGSFDLRQESKFGGFFGAELDLNANTSWYNEFLLTGDSWAFGTGINCKF